MHLSHLAFLVESLAPGYIVQHDPLDRDDTLAVNGGDIVADGSRITAAELDNNRPTCLRRRLRFTAVENTPCRIPHTGLAWQAVGRLQDAEASLRRAHALAPQDVEIVYALAIFYVQGEQWPEARRFTDELARLAPGARGVAELRNRIPPDGG